MKKNSFLLLVLCLLVLLAFQKSNAQASMYYVSASGNDFNDGLSPSTPFQTISKVNTLTLEAGDTILFKRGEVFRGELQINQSGSANNPIVIDGYGTGSKPIISGSVEVNGWVNSTGNIWQAYCPQAGEEVTGIYFNSNALPLGRYPNADIGYNTVLSHVGNTQITSVEPLNTNWAGAEIVLKTMQWILDRSTINAQNGSVLNFSATSYEPQDLWGYFIQNHPATLDETGEWYYNPQNKIISIFSSSPALNSNIVEATIYPHGIYITGSYVTVQNIQIEKTLKTGLYAQYASHIEVINTDIINSGEDGVWVEGNASDIIFENNLIQHVNNNGVVLDNVSNLIFRGNSVKNIAITPGRGKSGDGQYFAIRYYGDNANGNALIERNVLDSLGYVGIDFRCSNILIKENVISNYDIVKDDGGGIYTWNGGTVLNEFVNQQIISNIVYNAIGSTAGVHNGYPGAIGIYMDDCSRNVLIQDNTIFNCSGEGLMLHATTNITAQNNTVFNNGSRISGGQLLVNVSNCGLTNNLTLENNIFFSKEQYQEVARLQHPSATIGNYGSFNANYYCRPFDELGTIITEFGSNDNHYNLACWQTAGFGQDSQSLITPIQYNPFVINSTLSNNLYANGTFDTSIDGLYCWSPQSDCSTTWENNILNGGTLKITTGTESPTLCVIGIGSVITGQDYLLSFDTLGLDSCSSISTFLRQSVDDYRNLTSVTTCLLGTSATQHQVLFQSPTSEDNASIVFSLPANANTAWIDNVTLRAVDATLSNSDDNILFYVNPTSSVMNFTLPNGNFIDVYQSIYSGTINLQPFTSIILLRNSNLHSNGFNNAQIDIKLFPNPAQGYCTLQYSLPFEETDVIDVYDSLGRVVLPTKNLEQYVGQQQFTFNTNALTSGVYFVVFKSKDRVITKRIVISE